MKIAIIGTRGIPNDHGGFEQFAESLAFFLSKKQHKVYVYNSHDHPYKLDEWNGAKIIHKYDPEYLIGTPGQFVYDLNCILNSRKHNFDIILQLGYTSSSIWGVFLPKNAVIITNMDGLEWKRSKYNRITRKFLSFAEKLAILRSDYLIADSLGIKDYLTRKYNKESIYIAYGARVFEDPNEKVLEQYSLQKGNYDILIARLEPENNIQTILDGVVKAELERIFVVVGKHETKYGKYLKKRYSAKSNIKFLGGIYEQDHLNNIRYFSNLYFHGHSVGGTNPSLLEAMSCGCAIIAHNNPFNKGILGSDALYFNNSNDIKKNLKPNRSHFDTFAANNLNKIHNLFSEEKINLKYEEFFQKCKSAKLY
ncbi:DUF1972 domain-containing protein [Winogradskyella aurantiaca]|uniref:DUF1972 domain-containing protein n=1 Tax=Winogradskyella aurantiaca TaxID=2219558 RepID=UPI000E1D1AEC|nr:DUF1972 domain-containing protein [Winogradskyella aurantiaca]